MSIRLIDSTEMVQRAAEVEFADQAPEAAPEHERCDACGAPAAVEQRYCVVCGEHRRHVHDPATRFHQQASANARVVAGLARAGSRRRGPTLGTLLAAAVVPLALAIGIAIGHSTSGGTDTQLLNKLSQAIAAQGAPAPAASGSTATPATPAPAASQATSAHTSQATSAHKSSGARAKGSAGATAPSHGATSYARQAASASAPTSSKPTQQQLAQGGAAVSKVQHSSGKSYVNSQQSLPNQVAVP